jgi:23S rRNA maturation mini-RNase III
MMNDCAVLAFLGDSVYGLRAKIFVCDKHEGKNGMLHKEANKIVCANAQATSFDFLREHLTEDEGEIARRARNVNVNNVPKAAGLENYKKATKVLRLCLDICFLRMMRRELMSFLV